MRIRTGHGPKDWKDVPVEPQREPADLSSLSKFDLSPSWRQQNDRRWEKVKKANAA